MKEKNIKKISVSYTAIMDDSSEKTNTLEVDVDMGRGELINSWDKWMWKILERFRENFFHDKKVIREDNDMTIKIKLKE